MERILDMHKYWHILLCTTLYGEVSESMGLYSVWWTEWKNGAVEDQFNSALVPRARRLHGYILDFLVLVPSTHFCLDFLVLVPSTHFWLRDKFLHQWLAFWPSCIRHNASFLPLAHENLNPRSKADFSWGIHPLWVPASHWHCSSVIGYNRKESICMMYDCLQKWNISNLECVISIRWHAQKWWTLQHYISSKFKCWLDYGAEPSFSKLFS